MGKFFSFRQLNMHKAEVAAAELGCRLAHKPTICMLTEPCAAFNRVTRIPPNHTCVPGTTLPLRPRAAILLPRNLSHVYLEQLSNPDCAVTLLDTKRGKIVLASCYLDSKKAVVPQWLTKLIAFIDAKQYPSILSFDCNAHSQLYGPDTNDRGKLFEEFILENGLNVENRGTTPTFHAFRGGEVIESFIDVTLTKNIIPLMDWRVHSHEFNGSDHHSITWALPLEQPTPRLIRPWSTAKWDVFKETVASIDIQTPQNFTAIKID